MMTTSSSMEGQNIQRPPLFNGTNYPNWKIKMMIWLEGHELWEVTEATFVKPTKPVAERTKGDKELIKLNAKAMTAFHCALDSNEFNRISQCKSANEIWHVLEVTHEGTSKVKKSKQSVFQSKYELFKMQEDENITEMYTRFTEIVNALEALGKSLSEEEKVLKILSCSLTSDWESKANGIEESNDMATYKLEDLIGNLMAYELRLKHKKEVFQPQVVASPRR